MSEHRIVVTGANGWIGNQVVSEARGRGYAVTAADLSLYRGPCAVSLIANISSDRVFDLETHSGIRGADVVIHCAGYAHRPRETAQEIRRFDEINHFGTRRIIELAGRAGVPRLVYISSIAFYDWFGSGPVTEDCPTQASTAYARSKLAGERVCLESELDCRVVRLATVFGDGDRANFSKLAKALGRNHFLVPGRGTARKSVIPVRLVAELLVDLAVRESVAYRVVNLALPDVPTLSDICQAYNEICGLGRPSRVPMGLMKAAALLGDILDKVRPGFPLTTKNVRKLTTSTAVDVTRMREIWPDRKWPTFRQSLEQSADYYRSIAIER